MKYLSLLIIGIFAVSLVNAQAVFYNSRADWMADMPGPYTTENFEDLSQVNPGDLIACTPPLNSSSSDACALPGEIEPGIEFVDEPGPDPSGVLALGAGWSGTAIPSTVICYNTFADVLRLNLTNGDTVGFAAQVGAVTTVTNGTISVFDAADTFLGSVGFASLSSDMTQFFGVITSTATPISYLLFDVDGNNVGCYDDIDHSDSEPVALEPGVPVEFVGDYVLDPAYPNPFNPQSTIRFAVRETSPVTLTLFDALGQEVRTVFEGTVLGGQVFTATVNGDDLPSGIYVIRLQGETFTATRKMTLLK